MFYNIASDAHNTARSSIAEHFILSPAQFPSLSNLRPLFHCTVILNVCLCCTDVFSDLADAKQKMKYKVSNSSANWSRDALTVEEIRKYRIQVGLDAKK